MGYQAVFKRYELKYLLTRKQYGQVLNSMSPYMEMDKYGKTTVRNIYFDTDNYRLIRRSLEKPAYKEKLRIRSYCQVTGDGDVFVELKKKYKGIVYKRRLALPENQAMAWTCRQMPCPVDSQISREIDYFVEFYGQPKPTVFLSYDRQAYYQKGGGDFRITFDENILCRRTGLSLTAPVGGAPILPAGRILMEVKCSGGVPLWLTRVLTQEGIFKTSFSKYGTAYQKLIFPELFKSNQPVIMEEMDYERNF